MKKTFLYIVIFALTFINVSAAIIYLNFKYNNIFKLDFRPKPENDTVILESPEVVELKNQLKQQILDSLAIEQARLDSIAQVDEEGEEDIKKPHNPIEANEQYIAQTDNSYEKEEKRKAAREAYENWKKKTAAMYEHMEPGKAAKIIEKYSDNVARDILYAMNKKKAAKVLAALNPEFANQITKVR
ncbi:MAG: hypothetical protein SCALA702_26770 [Melioribacteraceae bacterium]|nr:MAG: hypothetical protein SCALA702_26770 [Melioribacteraceae bacterium]